MKKFAETRFLERISNGAIVFSVPFILVGLIGKIILYFKKGN